MEELRLSVKDKQDARIALLRYYSSECVAHSAYLIALAITLLAFVELTPYILEFATNFVFPTLPKESVTIIILSLVASSFIISFVYVLGRTIVWSYMRSAILGVKPKETEVTYDPDRTTLTFLLQLHEGCLDYVKKKHGFWRRFYGLRTRHLALVWVDLFILFLIASFLSLYL
jgi:hypothetical protein